MGKKRLGERRKLAREVKENMSNYLRSLDPDVVIGEHVIHERNEDHADVFLYQAIMSMCALRTLQNKVRGRL